MGLFTKLLTFPVIGPFQGLVAIAKHIQTQADQAGGDDAEIQSRLLELETLLMLEEISPEEYADRETALLEKLDAQLAEDEERRVSSLTS